MTQGWRTVRVFISSTFRDMQAERDHLVRFVFPRLRETLLRRRIHLVDVDLRWGVTADQNAFELCMDEIDRCQPRFLCMLGGRYGWVPPARAGDPAPDRSITASEVHYAALDRLDAPAFRYFYFRDPAVTAAIPEPWAAEYREPAGSPAAASLEGLKQRIAAARARTLTAAGVVAEASLPVLVYPCAWDPATARITRLEAFGERVYADVLASIDAEFGVEEARTEDPFAEERAAMDAFIEDRVERYVIGSRAGVFDRLEAHAAGSGGSGILCLVGAPGSGKSALLARFARDRASGRAESELLIAHFVGATAASTNVRQLLRRACHELASAATVPEDVPDDYEKLRDAFPALLAQAAARHRVLIVIDAINQLDPAFDAPGMRWLPDALPDGARLILSLLPGPALEALRSRREPPAEVTLAPLSPADATDIMDAYLDRYRKALDPAQRGALLQKADAGFPLYLLTALEELRTLGTYEEITERIRALPDRVLLLFAWILERLERDPGFRDAGGRLVGAPLVRGYASYLAVGRSGMAHSEVAELVAPGDPARGLQADAQGNAAALQRLLRPYLMRRGELQDFFHGQLREAVVARYLAGHDDVVAAHRTVADYFRAQADPAGDGSWAGQSARALSELPYHQTMGERWDDLHATLTDLGFLEAKCTRVGVTSAGVGEDANTVYGGVYDLLEDYRLALDRFPAE